MHRGIVLIVEDELIIGQDLKASLERFGYTVMDVVESGEKAVEHIRQHNVDIVLMDIVLKGKMDGIMATRIIQEEFDIPVVYITSFTDRAIVDRAVAVYPYGYMMKPFRNEELEVLLEITRQRHAIESMINAQRVKLKKRVFEKEKNEKLLQRLSLVDELTGIYNRRGFNQLVSQQGNLAKRNNKKMMIFFLDLDGLKAINDRFGHREGDRALMTAASILKNTFRSSDLVARWGGDEFAALLIDANGKSIQTVEKRLTAMLREYNHATENGYELSLSWGSALYDPEDEPDIDELIASADESMYREKSQKKSCHSHGRGVLSTGD